MDSLLRRVERATYVLVEVLTRVNRAAHILRCPVCAHNTGVVMGRTMHASTGTN